MVAATTQNAADDGSPGTSKSKGRGAPAVTRTARSSTRVIGAPSAASIRSLWSRLGAGSEISVVPSACSPARSSAVFTCALATVNRWVAPTRPPPRTMSGGSVPSARPSSCAPMARNGATTRPIGRRASESSPVSTLKKGRPARRPLSRRMVVPELPQSTTPVGSVNAATPCPETVTADPEMLLRTPSRVRAPRVRNTSSPPARPATRDRPSAMAANSSARCDMPLSPGTRNRPCSACGPLRARSVGTLTP